MLKAGCSGRRCESTGVGTQLCLCRALSRGVASAVALGWLAAKRLCAPVLCLGECSSGICDETSCIHGGTCTAVRADNYICLCPLGFKGRHCEDGEKEAS